MSSLLLVSVATCTSLSSKFVDRYDFISAKGSNRMSECIVVSFSLAIGVTVLEMPFYCERQSRLALFVSPSVGKLGVKVDRFMIFQITTSLRTMGDTYFGMALYPRCSTTNKQPLFRCLRQRRASWQCVLVDRRTPGLLRHDEMHGI